MNSIDALGSQSDHLSALTSELLFEQEDAELQAIVTEAARDLSTPIALVNLLLEQVQFFKAHHGLPQDLAAARGTDRNVSFCQFVVRDGKPFEVVDAEKDGRVPQHLVKHYGIKSYLGMPIMANDMIVGSLCVIDTKPRSFSEADRKNLQKLAGLVNARLAILAERRQQAFLQLKEQHFSNTVKEVANGLALIEEEILPGKSAAVAIGVFLRLMDHNAQNQSIPKVIIEQTLLAACEALVNCKDSLGNIEISATQAKASLAILEKLPHFSDSVLLSEVISNSLELTEPMLTVVGGATVKNGEAGHRILTTRSMAISVLSASLSLLANQLAMTGSTDGLEIDLQIDEERLDLQLTTTGLSVEVIAGLAKKLIRTIGTDPTLTIRSNGAGIVLVFALDTL